METLWTNSGSIAKSEARRLGPKGAGPLLYGEMMNCPYCSSMSCTRSLRYGVRDSVRRLLGLFPWDCRTCRTRFYWRKRYPDGRPYHARSVPGSGGQSRWPEGAGPMRNRWLRWIVARLMCRFSPAVEGKQIVEMLEVWFLADQYRNDRLLIRRMAKWKKRSGWIWLELFNRETVPLPGS